MMTFDERESLKAINREWEDHNKISELQKHLLENAKRMDKMEEENFQEVLKSIRQPPEKISNLFLRLWTKAIGTKEYDRHEWEELRDLLNIP